MSAAENKEIVRQIFSELAKGNVQPFLDRMADDFRWTVTGTTKWSKTYQGKPAVIAELLGVLQTRLAPPIIVIGERFLADEDFVVVEARGKNTTREGTPYNNAYCFVFRLAQGKLQQLTEYMDTHLVTAVFG